MKLNGEAKLFLGILIVAIPLAYVALAPTLNKPGSTPPPTPPPPAVTKQSLLQEPFHFKGAKDARYTLVEFGDYQCPQCKVADGEVSKILEKNRDKVRYIFRYYRATDRHKWAGVLARAAEAAEAQGKFWEMHKALFDRQEKFTPMTEMKQVFDELMDVAKELKLDMLKFKPDLMSEETQKAVAAAQVHAEKLNISATPSFYVVLPDAEQPMPIATTTQLRDWFNNASNLK
jgi:protein-disulfide isomerase